MFSEMLVAYDGSESAEESLAEAVTLARTFHANVHLVAVVHFSTAEIITESAFPAGLIPYDKENMERSLTRLAERFAGSGSNVETHVIIDNNPAAAIRDLAIMLGTDLIILGHRRQGPLSRLWNGSVGLSLLANAPCSIYVATDPHAQPIRSVVAPPQPQPRRQNARAYQLKPRN
jgi:nucleotide-binding universal stress UspA family protein